MDDVKPSGHGENNNSKLRASLCWASLNRNIPATVGDRAKKDSSTAPTPKFLSVKLSVGSREELVLKRTCGRELREEGLDLKDPQL